MYLIHKQDKEYLFRVQLRAALRAGVDHLARYTGTDAVVCAGVECRDGQVCAGGFCVFDDCTNVECPPGQICEMINSSPQCVYSDRPDNPIDPPMERPDMGMDPDEDMGNDEMPPPDFDGGMNPPPITPPPNPDMGPGQELPEPVGCNCDVGDGGPSPFTWLLLPLLALARVRRR